MGAQPLPCLAGLGAQKPHGDSLKVIVDVHPAILGDADEEGVQGNLYVLEMRGHKCTKESDPKHGEHLSERPKTHLDFTQEPWRQDMQMPCK